MRKLALVLFVILFTLHGGLRTSIGDDLKDAENVYFDHRVNHFDLSQITDSYLCSIALQNQVAKWEVTEIHKSYVNEALRRGMGEKECAKHSHRFSHLKY